ncbi:twin-arginine translocase subunit TatC [Bacillus gobiensis]|uniref:twin-arginine translocase subunit TatC n=1 Tax=Bacillus gobiensis TaxID=1441095 RepID=UPI003D1DA058
MNDQEIELTEHLAELRKRLIYVLGCFLGFLALSFLFVEQIYNYLVKDLEFKLALLGPGDVLWIYFKLSAVSSIAFTIPVAAFHIWRFVLPALKEHEKKATFVLIPALFFLFISGISFGYFFVFPTCLSFMQTLAGNEFQPFYTSEKYFSFMLNLTVPFGVLFELPVVILFLTSIGILNPNTLRKTRKIAYFLIAVASVFLTPPDFISDILVLIPLIFLYEISISLSAFIYRKKLKKQELLDSNTSSEI